MSRTTVLPARARAMSNWFSSAGGSVATTDEFGRLRRQAQDFGIDQRVIDHHVRAREQFRRAQREQPGVARSRADQIDHAFWLHRSDTVCGKPARLQSNSNPALRTAGFDYHRAAMRLLLAMLALALSSQAACKLTSVGVTPGRTNLVQASGDLTNWLSISTNVTSAYTFTVMDSTTTNFSTRFYRLVQLP